jgi:tetrapyrrole methylase family protein/MazG family protein
MSQQFDDLVRIMAKLRAPDGCPWDRKQTHDSLKPYLLEETYEVLETIDHQDTPKLKEELGDLLLQIVFHAQIGTEAGTFTIREVMEQLAEKLVRRHPHVFERASEGAPSLDSEQVYSRWEQIKHEERAQTGRERSALEGVPKALPALLRAYQVQARASRVGFDWPHTAQGIEHVFGKIDEEVNELREAASVTSEGSQTAATDEGASRDRSQVEAELGDMLFSVVNLARFLKVNPEDALRQATNRFCDRFHYIESEATRSGRRIEDLKLTEMDRLWEEAKTRPPKKKLAASEETP